MTKVVIGKLDKLVHKQNCSYDLFKKKSIASLLYMLDALLLKQMNIPVLDITDFLICFNSKYLLEEKAHSCIILFNQR